MFCPQTACSYKKFTRLHDRMKKASNTLSLCLHKSLQTQALSAPSCPNAYALTVQWSQSPFCSTGPQ